MTGRQIVGFAIVGQAEPLRKLPGQVDTSKGDCLGVLGLGRNMRGGTRPRLSCGRSWL